MVLGQVLAALREAYHAAGNGDLFEGLKSALSGQFESYAALADRSERSEEAIKVAVHRLRGRYRELMRARIAATVVDGDVEDELRHLPAVLSG